MTGLKKRIEKDTTIKDKLTELKQCPRCISYMSANVELRYHCDILPTERREGHDYFILTSFKKCTVYDMFRCAMVGNSKGGIV